MAREDRPAKRPQPPGQQQREQGADQQVVPDVPEGAVVEHRPRPGVAGEHAHGLGPARGVARSAQRARVQDGVEHERLLAERRRAAELDRPPREVGVLSSRRTRARSPQTEVLVEAPEALEELARIEDVAVSYCGPRRSTCTVRENGPRPVALRGIGLGASLDHGLGRVLVRGQARFQPAGRRAAVVVGKGDQSARAALHPALRAATGPARGVGRTTRSARSSRSRAFSISASSSAPDPSSTTTTSNRLPRGFARAARPAASPGDRGGRAWPPPRTREAQRRASLERRRPAS